MLKTFITFVGIAAMVVGLPVVVLHGIASSSDKMDVFSNWITQNFNVPVHNVEIGNGEEDSISMPMGTQLAILCSTLQDIPELYQGFDFIGMSQGGLLARGYVEQCNKPPVRNLITMVSPHGGVFLEFPPAGMYIQKIQESVSFSNYWRDPDNLLSYTLLCSYLPVINNERYTEMYSTQIINMLNLTNFQMIWSPVDGVLKPAESAKFSFLDKEGRIIPLNQSELYKSDYIGIRHLDETGRLRINQTTCTHVEHRDPVCFGQLEPILASLLTSGQTWPDHSQ